MHIFPFLMILFLLTLPLDLEAQFEEAFETPQPRRIRAFEKIRSDVYSSVDYAVQIKVFDALMAMAEKQHDPESVLYAKAWIATAEARMDTSRLKPYTVQMNGYIQQAKNFHNNILQAQLLMMLVDYVGDVHHHIGAAMGYHIVADEIMNGLKADEMPRSFVGTKHDLMIHLYDIGDYTRAKEIMDKSAHLDRHPVYQFFYADLHSQILLELHQYDSSAYFIRQARAMLEKDTGDLHKGWYGILEGNMGKIHYYKKEFAEAIPLLENAVRITNEAQFHNVTASFGLMLANSYMQLNTIENVRTLYPLIRKAVYLQSKDEHYIGLYKLELVLQEEISPKRTLQLLDSIEVRKQNLAKLYDRNLLTKSEMEAELAAFGERNIAMANEIKRQLWWRNVLWGFLGGAVLVAFYVFYIGKSRLRRERKRTTEIQEQSEQELDEAREQLLHFATSLQNKSSQIELLEFNLLASQQLESLEQLRQNSILTDEDWVKFKTLFEKVYPGFFALLKNKYPNLTAGELRYLALAKLSFTTREMASTLGVSPVSVRSIRSRLLKKLDLVESENLEHLISSL